MVIQLAILGPCLGDVRTQASSRSSSPSFGETTGKEAPSERVSGNTKHRFPPLLLILIPSVCQASKPRVDDTHGISLCASMVYN